MLVKREKRKGDINEFVGIFLGIAVLSLVLFFTVCHFHKAGILPIGELLC